METNNEAKAMNPSALYDLDPSSPYAQKLAAMSDADLDQERDRLETTLRVFAADFQTKRRLAYVLKEQAAR